MMIVFGDAGSELGFFFGAIANFVGLTNPTTFWFIEAVFWMFVLCHIFSL